MTLTILIVLSLTILLSFSFELVSHRIRIPTVVLLVLFGIIAQLITRYFNVYYPELKDVLPSLGTIGLILIVLEGAMDLDLSRRKKRLVTRAFFSSLLVLAFSSLILTGLFMITMGLDFTKAMINAVPFSVISSAVAIPATAGMKKEHAEFITYESTFSDIMGIIAFNFLVTYIPITFIAVVLETWYVVFTFIISLVVSAILLLFLDKVDHHIKYLPILAFIVLVYALGKYIHLSQLIMVFMFGLIVNNLTLFQFRVVRKRLNIPKVQDDLVSFKQLTKEAVFVAKTFFFVLFGFTADLSRFLHPEVFIFAVVIFLLLMAIRFLYFFVTARSEAEPLFYFAPRGLITILLFLSIPDFFRTKHIQEGMILLVVLFSIFFMVVGKIRYRGNKPPLPGEF